MPRILVLIKLLPKKYKTHLFFLQFFSFFTAALNVLGVGTILPFMSTLNDPQVVFKNDFSASLFNYFQISSPNHIILTTGGILFLTYALINVARIFLLLYTRRVTADLQTFLNSTLFHHLINKEITFHFENSSSALREYCWGHIARLGTSLVALLNIISSLFVCVLIAIFLIAMDPVIALSMTALISLAYVFQYYLIKKRINNYGLKMNSLALRLSKLLAESFIGIKDIIIKDKSNVASEGFQETCREYNRVWAHSAFLAEVPRFLNETILIGGLVGIVFALLSAGQSGEKIAPILAVYAAAGYRLMPAIQLIYSSLTLYKINILSLEDIEQHITDSLYNIQNIDNDNKPDDSIIFDKSIELCNIQYAYPSKRKEPALKDISCIIPKNQSIGFVGSSGSGKSTTIEVILGLLQPNNGQIKLDGIPLVKKNHKLWQKKIGYVPQSIFLTDSTISENIAFGDPPHLIDPHKVERAASFAELDSFVSDLPNKYNTIVGEHGVQLSGGQRQRIGIARALYENPELLIFDEATSALDGITESAIIESVNQFAHKKTIIMIAHRLSTVKNCDIIYFFENGKISQSGSYNQLLNSVPEFKTMAEGNKLS